MNKWTLFKVLLFLYSIVLLVFLNMPFELLTYVAYQGSMKNRKDAIVYSKEPLHQKQGYIKNQKYAFRILSKQKIKTKYFYEISFKKDVPQDDFTLYCRGERVSLWELMQKEWRLS